MTTSADHIMKTAIQSWKKGVKELAGLNKDLDRFRSQKQLLLFHLESLLESIIHLKETEPQLKFPKLEIPPELLFSQNTTIGNAMEIMLKQRGPLTQREIIDWLREAKIRISERNPHVTIANAIRKDKKKRFRKLKDRRVALKSKKERMLEQYIPKLPRRKE